MSSIGQGGPSSPLKEEWPAPIVVLEALTRFVPPETIRTVLAQTGRGSQRIRRLPATAVVWLVIAIGIWSDLDIPAIWRQVVGSLRSLLLVMGGRRPPCKAALSQARSRLGACCLRQLFLRTAAPIAGDRTRGAFYRRMRLMAIDGVSFDIPDTPANANAVRFFMHQAALSVDLDPRRLSFIHALRVLRETAQLLRAAPPQRWPALYAGMIAHIAQGQLPPRDNRINPRVVKKKMSNFPKKRPEHYRVQHPQTSFEQGVTILK